MTPSYQEELQLKPRGNFHRTTNSMVQQKLRSSKKGVSSRLITKYSKKFLYIIWDYNCVGDCLALTLILSFGFAYFITFIIFSLILICYASCSFLFLF